MTKQDSTYCVTSLTPTICGLFDIPLPETSTKTAIEPVMTEGKRLFGGQPLEKCLIYAPDAVGNHLYQRFPDAFAGVESAAPIRVQIQTVMPSVTPVCFGSMFSGAMPEVHGIREYAKPVLKCMTLFDSLAKAGKKAAIIASNECSIDKIFRCRPMDYFSTVNCRRAAEIAELLLEHDDYDLILCYNGMYDAIMHRYGVLSQEALREFHSNLDDFVMFSERIDAAWKGKRRALVFAPDHGAHDMTVNGEVHGTHGENIPDDIDINHFYALRK